MRAFVHHAFRMHIFFNAESVNEIHAAILFQQKSTLKNVRIARFMNVHTYFQLLTYLSRAIFH